MSIREVLLSDYDLPAGMQDEAIPACDVCGGPLVPTNAAWRDWMHVNRNLDDDHAAAPEDD